MVTTIQARKKFSSGTITVKKGAIIEGNNFYSSNKAGDKRYIKSRERTDSQKQEFIKESLERDAARKKRKAARTKNSVQQYQTTQNVNLVASPNIKSGGVSSRPSSTPSYSPPINPNFYLLERARQEKLNKIKQPTTISPNNEPISLKERFYRLETTGEDVSTRTLGAAGGLGIDVVEGGGSLARMLPTNTNIIRFIKNKDFRDETINSYQSLSNNVVETVSDPMKAGYEVGLTARTRPERFGLEVIGMVALEGFGAGFKGTRLVDDVKNPLITPTEETITTRFPELKKTVLKGYEVSDNILETATKQRQTVLRPGGRDPASIRYTPPLEEYFDPLDIARRQPGQEKLYRYGYEQPLSIAQEQAAGSSFKVKGREVQTFIDNAPANTELVVTSKGFIGKRAQQSVSLGGPRSFRNTGNPFKTGSSLPPPDKIFGDLKDIGKGAGRGLSEGFRLNVVEPITPVIRSTPSVAGRLGIASIDKTVLERDNISQVELLMPQKNDRGLDLVQEKVFKSSTPVVEDVVSQPRESVKVNVISLAKPDSSADLSSFNKGFSRTPQKVFSKLDNTLRYNPIEKIPRRRRVPKPGFSLPGFGGSDEVFRQAFDVQVRRKGKFRTIGRGLTKAEAFKLGRERTENTLAATFRLEPRGKTSKKDDAFSVDLNRFYRKGGLTFIEKANKRIKTGGEKKEIKRKKREKGVFDELSKSFRL